MLQSVNNEYNMRQVDIKMKTENVTTSLRFIAAVRYRAAIDVWQDQWLLLGFGNLTFVYWIFPRFVNASTVSYDDRQGAMKEFVIWMEARGHKSVRTQRLGAVVGQTAVRLDMRSGAWARNTTFSSCPMTRDERAHAHTHTHTCWDWRADDELPRCFDVIQLYTISVMARPTEKF